MQAEGEDRPACGLHGEFRLSLDGWRCIRSRIVRKHLCGLILTITEDTVHLVFQTFIRSPFANASLLTVVLSTTISCCTSTEKSSHSVLAS